MCVFKKKCIKWMKENPEPERWAGFIDGLGC